MNFEDERWVKLYTRDTMGWRILTWQARTTLLHALRKVDRTGSVDLGEDGFDGLAVLLDLPPEIVADGVRGERGLVSRGVAFLERSGEVVTKCDANDTGRDAVFVLANFAVAQNARASAKQRARKSREERAVTKRDESVRDPLESVTKRDATVTRGHTASRSDQNRIEENRDHPAGDQTHAREETAGPAAIPARLRRAAGLVDLDEPLAPWALPRVEALRMTLGPPRVELDVAFEWSRFVAHIAKNPPRLVCEAEWQSWLTGAWTRARAQAEARASPSPRGRIVQGGGLAHLPGCVPLSDTTDFPDRPTLDPSEFPDASRRKRS